MNEKYKVVEGGLTIVTKMAHDRDDEYDLFLDATTVGRLEDSNKRQDKTRRILKLLDSSGIGNRWYDQPTPDLAVEIGWERHGYGVYGMRAHVAWPQMSDSDASARATEAMQNMAHNLGEYTVREIPSLVYAQVSRTNGISLETNPAGACSMDTDGTEYDPSDEYATLYSHNLYTHQMQLICIAGLIALTENRS